MRTDAHRHRLAAGDSELADAVKIIARAHQALIWSRRRYANAMRAAIREYYPAILKAFGEELHDKDAVSIITLAPTPALGRKLTLAKITAALKRGGRSRYLDSRSRQIYEILQSPQLEASATITEAFAIAVRSQIGVITGLNRQIELIEDELTEHFELHPDAEIILSLPGLGYVLGARVLGEFGDDPNRYDSAKSRRNYPGTSPVTRASGNKHLVFARTARNARLADATYMWAFGALCGSKGARDYYDKYREAGASHNRALRAVANRMVGIFHGCLRTRTLYDEHRAWHNHIGDPEPEDVETVRLIA